MSNSAIEMTRMQRLAGAEEIVASLPAPDYLRNYQPLYPDQDGVVEAVAENLSTEGVTTPRQADSLTEDLAAMSQDNSTFLVITGGCRETIHIDVDIAVLGERAEADYTTVSSSQPKNIVQVVRNRGQYKKPRSQELEGLPDGTKIPSYMGDVVNGEDHSDRTPDPSRMVAGAVQARDLEAELTRRVGHHIHAAHEALLLPYEKAFVRRDVSSGRSYSESADLLWCGLRTNQLESPVIDLLAGIENSVGVKIGGNSDPAHIAGLAERLNPQERAGKLIFMLRLGLHEADKYPTILGAIRKYAPNSIKVFDIHGTTEKLPDGTKIRNVNSIIKGLRMMAQACHRTGVRFDGVHLETTPSHERLECINHKFERPTHEGGIDPQLNPTQTKRVLSALALLQPAA